jgi:hypothetical protein
MLRSQERQSSGLSAEASWSLELDRVCEGAGMWAVGGDRKDRAERHLLPRRVDAWAAKEPFSPLSLPHTVFLFSVERIDNHRANVSMSAL